MKPLSRKDQRAEARRLYRESGGAITLPELSRKIGISRESLGKWRKADCWDLELDIIREAATLKSIEHMTCEVVPACRTNFEETLDKLAEQVDLAISGEKQLSSGDIVNLARAMGSIIQHNRLLHGQSTSNESVRAEITGHPGATSMPENDPFHRSVQNIIQTGSAEGQVLIAQHIETLQKLMQFGKTEN